MEEATLPQSLGEDLLECFGHSGAPSGRTKHGVFHAALFEIPEDFAAILERFLIAMPDRQKNLGAACENTPDDDNASDGF